MTILIMTCSKSPKWLCQLWLVQSHQNDYFNYDLFKVTKMTMSIMTCSKPAKWLIIMTCSKLAVLNKAIHDAF